MTTQILTPDFGSAHFCRRSFTSQAVLAAPLVERKRVRFARQLTDEYTIAHRRCRRGMSTSDEELCNRVHRIRRQLKFEKKIVAYQAGKEEHLGRMNDKLYSRFDEAMTDLQCKKAMDTLATSIQHLDDDIFNLRMDMIRIKGLHSKVLVELKTAQDRKNAESCCAVVFAQSLWAMATGPTKPSGGASLAA